MSRIGFVCISLRAGGTERVVSTLANHLVGKHEVDVILLSDAKSFYELDPRVRVWQFRGKGRGLRRALYYARLSIFIRSTVKRNGIDVILSFGELIGPFVTLALFGLPLKTFVFNRGSPYRSMAGASGWINPLVYPLADGVVVQTFDSLKVVQNRYRFCRLKLIPNPINLPPSPPANNERRKIVVNVGSIGRLKNQELLIRLFAKVDASKEWQLHFVGDGPDRPRLEAMVDEIGLKSRIKFLGERHDVSKILAESQVFAFVSLSEGFPNALAEALAHGCACISFNCPVGPSDLIENDVNGLLIPMADDHRYRKQLHRLLSDGALRSRLSQHAVKDMQKFSLETVVDMFEQLIIDATA